MKAPTVSVLIAVFNTERYVGAAIRSVLDQTLHDIEVLVVDDCSSDGSWAVVEAEAARDSRVVAIRRQSNAGASAALNEALTLAKGAYVTRHDSDDLCAPTRLAEQVAFLEANPAVGAVGTAVEVIDGDGRPFDVLRFPATDDEIQPALLERMCFCGPTVMARRETLDRIRFRFDEALSSSEDYDLCLRLAEVTRLANLDQPVYLYRQHAASVSRSQRHTQLVRKAHALERAVYRRYGPDAGPDQLRNVARDHLRAAVVGHAARERSALRDCVTRALELDPTLLDNSRVIERIVRKYTPASSDETALDFTESLFADLLPRTGTLTRLKRRLLGELHVEAAFAARAAGRTHDIRPHLWAGIGNDPRWLANRGVLSLILRRPGSGAAAANAHRP